MFLGDLEGCFNDLKIWDDGRQNVGEENTGLQELTHALIKKFYSSTGEGRYYGIMKDIHIDEVCPSDKYHVTSEIEPYLQCVQHFRRIQTVHMGQRWFDIKRYGFSIKHKWGKDDVVVLQPCDKRYAMQIPDEVIGAGLQPNPRD